MEHIKIIPGILEKNLLEIKRKISLVEGLVDLVQIDLIDGKFAPNTTFLDVAELEKILTPCEIELHIQANNPELFLPKNTFPVKKVIVHLESATFDRNLLEEIKARNLELGVALNPETEIYEVEPFFEYMDTIQFMTVHSGFQGRQLIKSVLEKIKFFNEMKTGIPVEVDGGVNDKTIKLIAETGATLIEAGFFVFQNDAVSDNLSKLEKALYEN